MPGLLTLAITLPIIGAVLLMLVPNRDGSKDGLIRNPALGVSLAHLRGHAGAVGRIRPACVGARAFQFVERHRWIPAFGIDYYVGIDGLSLMLLVLTGFLTPIALLSAWESIEKKVKEFSIFMLLLEASMIGVFCALDIFLFYVFWDFVLIPMYFLIGIWGYDQRIYAAVKFILYTMAGSVLMLVAIIGLSWMHQSATGEYSFDLLKLYELQIPAEHAVLVLPGVHARVHHQGAAVPVPHLAARRARAGADARLGDPGRRDAEDGRLRLDPPRLPAVPGGRALLRAAARHARRSSPSSTARWWRWCSRT